MVHSILNITPPVHHHLSSSVLSPLCHPGNVNSHGCHAYPRSSPQALCKHPCSYTIPAIGPDTLPSPPRQLRLYTDGSRCPITLSTAAVFYDPGSNICKTWELPITGMGNHYPVRGWVGALPFKHPRQWCVAAKKALSEVNIIPSRHHIPQTNAPSPLPVALSGITPLPMTLRHFHGPLGPLPPRLLPRSLWCGKNIPSIRCCSHSPVASASSDGHSGSFQWWQQCRCQLVQWW